MLNHDVAGVPELREVLVRHGYLAPDAAALLGDPPAAGAQRHADLPLYLRRLAAAPGPLATLLRLFALHAPAPLEEVRAALAPLTPEALQEMGLLALAGGEARPLQGIAAFEDLLVASDVMTAGGPEGVDHVLGVNPPTVSLAQLTPRRRVGTALDMGCGSGVQAFLLARHAGHVTGVDKNPRALAAARFNAALNGIRNVELLEGDFFAPVAGRRFDLVVSNPPYVISPDSTFTFRDGGRGGDGVSAEVAAGAAAHLAPGGVAVMLCNWAVGAGERFDAGPRRWLAGSGCDALLLCRGLTRPLDYAAAWTRSTDRDAYAAALERWSADHARRGIAAIGQGVLAIRRGDGPPGAGGDTERFQAEEYVETPRPGAGDHLARMLEAMPAVDPAAGDDAFLASRWRLDPACRLLQRSALEAGEIHVENVILSLEGGLGFHGALDPAGLELLRTCDEGRTLGDVVSHMTSRSGSPDRAQLLAALRRYASLGFLLPAAPRAG